MKQEVLLNKRKWSYLLGCLCLFGATAFGELLPGKCDIQFVGTSTLHGFHGSVSSVPFELDFQKIDPANYTLSGSLTTAVAEMDTGNKIF